METKKRSKKSASKPLQQCKICKKTVLGNSYKLKAHMYQHKAVAARFKCSICSKEFFRSDVYTKHMNGHTGLQAKKYYTCDHCDRAFVNKRNLIIHLKVHDDSLAYSYKCVACGNSYCEQRLLKYHIRKTHYNLQSTVPIEIKREQNETWVERVKESEICVEMTQVNDNVLSIKKYGPVKLENEERQDQVNRTDEKAKFKRYITSVLAENDRSQYSKAKCDYCHKEMLKKSLLSHIRERHLKLRKFRCEVCDRSFCRHYQLVDHECGKQRRRRKMEKSDKKQKK
ncbi:hypothetical protein O0L34_g15872 [Tuta absoluta]|nr:hypothetical protein O0L34_g15872 [Tuta absoluta]